MKANTIAQWYVFQTLASQSGVTCDNETSLGNFPRHPEKLSSQGATGHVRGKTSTTSFAYFMPPFPQPLWCLFTLKNEWWINRISAQRNLSFSIPPNQPDTFWNGLWTFSHILYFCMCVICVAVYSHSAQAKVKNKWKGPQAKRSSSMSLKFGKNLRCAKII